MECLGEKHFLHPTPPSRMTAGICVYYPQRKKKNGDSFKEVLPKSGLLYTEESSQMVSISVIVITWCIYILLCLVLGTLQAKDFASEISNFRKAGNNAEAGTLKKRSTVYLSSKSLLVFLLT